MALGKGRDPRYFLVHLGIEFHGARSERIEAGVDSEIALREGNVMADHVELRKFGQAAIGAHPGGRERRQRHIYCREFDTVSPRYAQFVDGRYCASVHRTASARAPTSMSILARVLTSVTAINM